MTATDARITTTRSGLTMAEVLMLPPQQRKIVQWLMKRSPDGVTLTEAALHIDLNQQATLALLDELVEEGFVQEILTSGEVQYRVNLAAKRGIQQQKIQQSLAPGNPLAVIFNPSGDYAVQAGSKFEIYVTVTNKGAESALIDIFIDELSQQLIQWCVAPRQRLALGSNSISEVLFEFQVPLTAIPSTYNYSIVIDAPLHYPEDTPIRHGARIQVLPAIETVVRVSDPTFTLLPPTSSRSPALIPPGGILQVNVNVHNRSDRVDRFRLSCTDFEESWYSVRYPEGLETAGLVIPNMGLNLNPGEQGEILLQFNPPLGVTAGLYYPTIRLYSANNPDLVLLDVVYLEILPSYLLNAELLIVVGRVRRKHGAFEVKLTNAGNTVREIVCRAISAEEDKLCTYTVSPALLRVLPGEKSSTQVTVTPVKWWHRPIFGAGRLLNFRIEIEDQQQLPLPYASLPGTLIWEPRPWWQFLLVLLTVLGTVGAIAFSIWWLLRPPAQPKAVQFNSSDALYQQANNDFIRLSWQIHNPKALQNLSLSGLFADGTAAVQPIVYNFNNGVPKELQQYCQMQAMLTCSNVPTDARKPGDYVFELQAFAKKNPEVAANLLKTNTIKIVPVPPPTILEFSSAKPIYQEVPINLQNNKISPDTIRLNWQINNLDTIKELRVIGRSPENLINSPLQVYNLTQGVPHELKAFCMQLQNQLACQNVPANNRGAGNYIFELQILSKTDTDKPSASQKTDVIKVQPLPSKIVEFKINNSTPLPKYSIPLNRGKSSKFLNLSWKVEGSSNIKVELLPAPGTVSRVGTIPYPISQQPSSETITLQVTSATGEKISRAVTIETFLPPTPASSPTNKLPKLEGGKPEIPVIPTPSVGQPAQTPGNAGSTSPTPTASPSSGSSPSLGSPEPSQPGKLSPLELPPGFD
ncbi:hypothetical protein I8752_05320 [Nostocaceae cyanobacterium CENA369]|uniref:Uncharacterized protein n=1 Tax=Dendronalium phyllosphericum CENA369 TaxID=1725256 RepID=A0A8J7LE63_9NOST|nr:hypothetical protein [Dendronalium phyllosphericum]MBH8572464.1 hypothetical protein [Dendronalium phyllosphericum CENA369]